MKIIFENDYNDLIELISGHKGYLDANDNKYLIMIKGCFQSGKTFICDLAIEKVRNDGLFDSDHIIISDLSKGTNNIGKLLSRQPDNTPYLVFLDNCRSGEMCNQVLQQLSPIKKAVIICSYALYDSDLFYNFDLFYNDDGQFRVDHKKPLIIRSSCLTWLISPARYLKLHNIPVDSVNFEKEFDDYVKYSSFPSVAVLNTENHIARDNQLNLTCAYIMNQIVSREECDLNLLYDLLRIILKNIGRPLTNKKICTELNNSFQTITKYLDILKRYSLIYECPYRDENGAIMDSKKYYAGYTSFLHYMLDESEYPSRQLLLENVFMTVTDLIFYKLEKPYGGVVSRSKYDFCIGLSDNFIEPDDEYYSICVVDPADKNAIICKIRPLKKIRKIIKDKVKVYLLTDDTKAFGTVNGVEVKNIYEWFLEQ